MPITYSDIKNLDEFIRIYEERKLKFLERNKTLTEENFIRKQIKSIKKEKKSDRLKQQGGAKDNLENFLQFLYNKKNVLKDARTFSGEFPTSIWKNGFTSAQNALLIDLLINNNVIIKGPRTKVVEAFQFLTGAGKNLYDDLGNIRDLEFKGSTKGDTTGNLKAVHIVLSRILEHIDKKINEEEKRIKFEKDR